MPATRIKSRGLSSSVPDSDRSTALSTIRRILNDDWVDEREKSRSIVGFLSRTGSAGLLEDGSFVLSAAFQLDRITYPDALAILEKASKLSKIPPREVLKSVADTLDRFCKGPSGRLDHHYYTYNSFYLYSKDDKPDFCHEGLVGSIPKKAYLEKTEWQECESYSTW